MSAVIGDTGWQRRNSGRRCKDALTKAGEFRLSNEVSGDPPLVTFASVSGYASKRRRSTLALDDGRLGQRNAECVGCTAWGRRLGSARGWVKEDVKWRKRGEVEAENKDLTVRAVRALCRKRKLAMPDASNTGRGWSARIR